MEKILIVDPDEVLAAIYSEELAEEGYVVTGCSDSAKLMHVIVSERPDLILIDTQMVLYPGEGFYREIENHFSMVPHILYTSSLRAKPKKWAISPENFVRKTRDLRLLKNKISSAISGRPMGKKRKTRVPMEQMAFVWKGEKIR
jgi:DNA-binding NtrC family response regulator